MNTKTHSVEYLRKRRFFMVLPLLVLPFITVAFWALGGGKSSNENVAQVSSKGLNMELPEPYLKGDESFDKLSYYEKAASDSAKLEQLMKSDPYYKNLENKYLDNLYADSSSLEAKINSSQLSGPKNPHLNGPAHNNYSYSNPNEARVYKKLDELNKALNQSAAESDSPHLPDPETSFDGEPSLSRVENSLPEDMSSLTQQEAGDPEMQQLNQMMEKILDIQHPERMKEKIRQTSEVNKGQVFAVTVGTNNELVSLLENTKAVKVKSRDSVRSIKSSYNGFYSLDEATSYVQETQNAIQAVITETQSLVEGATVRLRLLNDIYINGVLVPKNSFVFGKVSLKDERLNIQINSVRYKNALFPVQLIVFDMDGMEGIYIPGAISRDVAKQSADQVTQDISLNTMDPRIGAQAASAGIEAAKSLLSKKAKLIKVTVKAGYQVLLFDEKQKTSS